MIITIKDDFDLDKIAESGQCFRWQKFNQGHYFIIHLNNCLEIKYLNNDTYELSCSQEEYNNIWKDYFDLNENYKAIRESIPKEDTFLTEAANMEKGVRILKQDPWEMIVSFIISQKNNIPSIKKSIEKICVSFGNKNGTYYTMPTPEKLSKASLEELKQCGVGYRDKYLLSVAKSIQELDIRSLKLLDDEHLLIELKKLYGVGDKVANCVMLFGFHRINAFPIDVWVKRILENEYKDGYPMEKYSPYNGIYQQYMFAYYRNDRRK